MSDGNMAAEMAQSGQDRRNAAVRWMDENLPITGEAMDRVRRTSDVDRDVMAALDRLAGAVARDEAGQAGEFDTAEASWAVLDAARKATA